MQIAERSIVRPDDGERVSLYALGVRFMIDGDSTGERFSLVEHPLPPRALGSPIHTHHNEDEYTYVLRGRVGFQLGETVLTAGPGELVLKPRGMRHAFWNAGEEPASMLELISPAGFEDYFRDLAPVLAAPVRDDAKVAEIARRHGLDIDFASVSALVERHGLRMG